MKNNVRFHHADIDVSHLKEIRGALFTHREIDVISCLLSGKTLKTIASFLDMSPRTVEAHTRAIMLKVGCNSRDAIVNFAEKSTQFYHLKNHYMHLSRRYMFCQTLKKIEGLNKADTPMPLVMLKPKADQKWDFLYQISFYLKLSGFIVEVEEKATMSFSSEHDAFISGQLCKVEHDVRTPICYVFRNMARLSENSDEMINVDYVDFEIIENELSKQIISDTKFYSNILEILKRIKQTASLDTLIDEFNKQHDIISDVNEDSIISNKKSIQNVSEKKKLDVSFFKSKKSKILTGLMFLSLIVSVFTFKGFLYKTSIPAYSIRSDLLIPHEEALLNRSHLLNQINASFTSQTSVIKGVTLLGIGGVGKTTLARRYAREQTNPIVWEINAETHMSLVNSFMNLASTLVQTKEQSSDLALIKEIQNTEEKEKKLMTLVKSQLKKNDHWFLIYDNVDSFSEIKPFFPFDGAVWGKGCVLITTRNSNVLSLSYIEAANVIHVDQLNQENTFLLFSKILYTHEPHLLTAQERTKVRDFLTKIPPFPLDVSLAAYYIKNASLTFDQYIERIMQNNYVFDKGQQAFLKEVSDYAQTRYGLIKLSFTKIIETNPYYKDLLFLICFLDSQNIPLNLLSSYKDPILIDHFLHDVKKYSLITTDLTRDKKQRMPSISLHRSTQQLGMFFLLNLLNNEDKRKILDKIIMTFKRFNEVHEQKNRRNINILLPHIEAFLKNLNEKQLLDQYKEHHFEEKTHLVLGYSHYYGTRNLVLAREHFCHALRSTGHDLTKKELALVLRDLGATCVDLGLLDEGLSYCQKSLSLSELLPESEILRASTQKIIGVAYLGKGNIQEAEKQYHEALKTISELNEDSLDKADGEAEIYDQLAFLHSITHINKPEALKAEAYAIKALAILKSTDLFYVHGIHNALKDHVNILHHITKHKIRLGQVYSRLGDYKKAMETGFREAEYILTSYSDYGIGNLLNSQIYFGKGEVALRKNELNEAVRLLSTCMNITEQLVGKPTWHAKVLRAEALIRLVQMNEAYRDCEYVLTLYSKSQLSDAITMSNYSKLLHLMCIYHASIIKYKQKEFKKAFEHFEHFCKEAHVFCKHFLNDNIYKELERKQVFRVEGQEEASIKTYLERSYAIFSSILGDSHPFIQGYVLKNKNS